MPENTENMDAELNPEAKAEGTLAKADTGVALNRAKVALKDDDEPEGQLTIDVYQTPSEIVIESTIAGVKPEDLDVDVATDSVSIRGARRHEKEVKDEDYFYRECYWGRFSRSIILPQEVDPDAAVVNLKNGILTIHLPKLNRAKSKKLKVKIE